MSGPTYSGSVPAGFCVYLLRDPAGAVRYVGKGTKARPEISAASRGFVYELAAADLPEKEAFAIEARLINLLSHELDNAGIPPWPRGYFEQWECREGTSPELVTDHASLLRSFLNRTGISIIETARRLGLPNPEAGGRVTVTRWAKGKPCTIPLVMFREGLAALARDAPPARGNASPDKASQAPARRTRKPSETAEAAGA